MSKSTDKIVIYGVGKEYAVDMHLLMNELRDMLNHILVTPKGKSKSMKSFTIGENNNLIEMNIPLNRVQLMILMDADSDDETEKNLSKCSECVYAALSIKIK